MNCFLSCRWSLGTGCLLLRSKFLNKNLYTSRESLPSLQWPSISPSLPPLLQSAIYRCLPYRSFLTLYPFLAINFISLPLTISNHFFLHDLTNCTLLRHYIPLSSTLFLSSLSFYLLSPYSTIPGLCDWKCSSGTVLCFPYGSHSVTEEKDCIVANWAVKHNRGSIKI